MIGRFLRLYCVVCALLLTPVVAAVAVGYGLGFLPKDSMQRVVQALETRRGPSREEVVTTEVVVPPKPMVDDPRLWDRRLAELGTGILENVDELDARLERLQAERERMEALGAATAELLSAHWEEEVTADDLVANQDAWIERMNEERDETQRRPWMLDTLRSMEPKKLAPLLAGDTDEAAPGLDEELAVELLGGLPPRTAGQILSEVGKLDSARAASLLARLGQSPAPTDPTKGRNTP